MKIQEYTLKLNVYSSINELPPQDISLIKTANDALELSYSPYSKFKVASAAILTDGKIIQGSNQENSSFGATICAERVLLAIYSSLTSPKSHIETIAVTYKSSSGTNNSPISPCGICRQALSEIESLQQQPIRLLLCGQSGKVWEVPSVSSILPLAFDGTWFSE